jgi:UDP-glucose 4-epimerase
MVVPTLVRQALRNEPLTVYGDGRQTRCFTLVGDVVPALVKLAGTSQAYGQAVNLGGETEISIIDLAARIITLLESRSSIIRVPYEEAYGPGYEDMRRRVPDNTRARHLIGFDPHASVDEIIRLVAESQIASGERAGAFS